VQKNKRVENNTLSEDSELDLLIKKYSPYLAEIRKRFLITLAFFAAGTTIGFIFYENIIKFLIGNLSLKGVNVVFTSPFQFINLAISCGIATGLVFVFPFLIYQIFSFLRPALKDKEYNLLLGFVPSSIFLFVVGFLFGIVVMKWQIEIFLSQTVTLGIGNILDISHLLSLVLLTSALMGAAFQFPIVIFILLRLDIINHHQLSKQRLWVYLGSFIFAILLPPDSVLADVLLSLPLIVLFEVTLLLDRIFQRKKDVPSLRSLRDHLS